MQISYSKYEESDVRLLMIEWLRWTRRTLRWQIICCRGRVLTPNRNNIWYPGSRFNTPQNVLHWDIASNLYDPVFIYKHGRESKGISLLQNLSNFISYRLAYRPIYMTHGPCYILLYDVHQIRFDCAIRQSILQDTHVPFHFRQWLGISAMQIGGSYSSNFQQVLAHVANPWAWNH